MSNFIQRMFPQGQRPTLAWAAGALLLMGLGIVGYYLWQNRSSDEPLRPEDLTPAEAVAVFEIRGPDSLSRRLAPQFFWQNGLRLPFFESLQTRYYQLDTLLREQVGLEQFFHGRRLLVAYQPLPTGENAYLFLSKLSVTEQNKLWKWVRRQKESAPNQVEERRYRNYQIVDLQVRGTNRKVSCLIYRGILMASFSGVLLEGHLDKLANQKLAAFPFQQAQEQNLAAGNLRLHLQYDRLSRWWQQYRDSSQGRPFWDFLGRLGQTANLEASPNNEQLLFHGTSTAQGDQFLRLFQAEPPQPFLWESYVSNRTASFLSLSWADALSWRKRYLRRFAENDSLPAYENLFRHMGKGAAKLTLEPLNQQEPQRLVLLPTRHPQALDSALRNLAAPADTLYQEEYAKMQLRQLPTPELPAQLFGEWFRGFEQVFWARMDSMLVLSNSIEGLKTLHSDRRRENTWSKSVGNDALQKDLMHPANLRMGINFRRAFGMLQRQAGPTWKERLQAYPKLFGSFQFLTLRHSYTEKGRCKTQSQLAFQNRRQSQESDYKILAETYFQYPPERAADIVRHYRLNRNEVLVVDSANQLFRISPDGTVMFKKRLQAPVVSDIIPLDLKKNGQPFYYFATRQKLHLLNDDGLEVKPFPKALPGGEAIAFANAIDYDNSKNYRLAAATESGAIYLFNTAGKNLKGWKPRKTGGPLGGPPFHVRIKNKDCIIALNREGKLQAIKRNSTDYPGFPVELGGRSTNPVFVDRGTSMARSTLTTLTDRGQLQVHNLRGEKERQKQLYRPSGETRFELLPEPEGRTYAIFRQSDERFAFLGRDLQVHFENEMANKSPKLPQYYNFGGLNEWFVLTDTSQRKTYLFDRSGQTLNKRPIPSSRKIAVIFSAARERFYLYRIYGRRFYLLTFKAS